MSCIFSSIAVIGYGKFGRLAYKILKEELPSSVRLSVYTETKEEGATGVEFLEFADLQGIDVLILAVPMARLEPLLMQLSAQADNGVKKLVIDVCSVKIFPKQKMQELLPAHWDIVCTHPLFGPASFRANSNSLRDFSITVENVRTDLERFTAVKNFLRHSTLTVLELSAEDHDRFFGEPQFLTHLSAALFKGALESGGATFEGLRSVDLFRASMKLLTSDESLLKDMYQFNPYATQALDTLQANWERIKKTLSRTND